MDPFSGRGTTLLEARLLGRVPLASDLNPIAIALSEAKNANVTSTSCIARIDELEHKYNALLYLPEAQVQPDEILLIYHPKTLAQLCYLRRRLGQSDLDVDRVLIGLVLGVMHGGERDDGSSAYASISMPNTFSMSPDYVRRYVETKRLQRIERNVFDLLRAKLGRLFREESRFLTKGVVVKADAKKLSQIPEFEQYHGRVKLILTSPPYLDVVNYAKQNWIRDWFLQGQDTLPEELDDNLTLGEWLDFTSQCLKEMMLMLAPGGVAVWVIGDVAKSSNTLIPLAREFIRQVLHAGNIGYVGCLSDHLQVGQKTTRIWKDTKGQATAIDRVVVLSQSVPSFDLARLASSLLPNSNLESPQINAEDLAGYAKSFAG